LPTERDYEAVWKAKRALEKRVAQASSLSEADTGETPVPHLEKKAAQAAGLSEADTGETPVPHLSLVPDEPLPPVGTLGFRVQRYGMLQWGDLFTARQKLALGTLGKAVQAAGCSSTLKDLLALAIDRVSSRSSSLCLWRYHADQEKVEHIFGRQALPVVWDFAEAVVISESTGSFQDGIDLSHTQCNEKPPALFSKSRLRNVVDSRSKCSAT
jgi:adenine-specific DNA methylase